MSPTKLHAVEDVGGVDDQMGGLIETMCGNIDVG